MMDEAVRLKLGPGFKDKSPWLLQASIWFWVVNKQSSKKT